MSFTIPATLAAALLLSPAAGPEPSYLAPGPAAITSELPAVAFGEARRKGPLVEAPAVDQESDWTGAPNPWTIVGNAGWGAPGPWHQQIQGPTFSAQFLRRDGARFEMGVEITGFLGRPDEEHRVSEHPSYGRTESLTVRKEQHWGVLSRVNYLLGEEGVRPYLSGGFGLAWGRRQTERTSRTVAPDGTVREWSNSYDSGGPGLANLLAAGVEIPLGDRLRLRPEVGILSAFPGFLFKPQVTASVVVPLGDEPAPMPPPDPPRRPRRGTTPSTVTDEATGDVSGRTGERAVVHDDTRVDESPSLESEERVPWSSLRDAIRVVAREAATRPSPPPADDAWRPVMALPAGELVEVEIFPGFHAFNPDGALQRPKGGELFGTVAEVNRDGIRLVVETKSHEGRWFVSRDAVRRITTGVIARDPAWEGIGIGMGIGWGIGALLFAADADEFSPVVIPYTGLLIGAPLAVLGGIADYRKPSFRSTSTVYVGQR